MTVKELIKELEKYPQDKKVMMFNYYLGYFVNIELQDYESIIGVNGIYKE